jgi:hypothetical protein
LLKERIEIFNNISKELNEKKKSLKNSLIQIDKEIELLDNDHSKYKIKLTKII